MALVAGCGGSAASPTPGPTPSAIHAGSFAELPYTLELPDGWVFGTGEDLDGVVDQLAQDHPEEAAKLKALLADSPEATSGFVAFDLASTDEFTPNISCLTLDRGNAAIAAVLNAGERQNVDAIAQLPNIVGQPVSDRLTLPVGETVRVRWTWRELEGDAQRASIGYLFVGDAAVVTCVFSADLATIASHEPGWETILGTFQEKPGASPGPTSAPAVVDMHDAPELEALIPTTVAGRRLTIWSVRGEAVLRLWGLSPSEITTVKGELANLGAPLDEVVQATAGRSDTEADPPYFVFAFQIPGAARDLLGGYAIRSIGFTRDSGDWQMEDRVVGGKDVQVGPLDLIRQSEHERGRPYLYVTSDDVMFTLVTDDEGWAADALAQLPATAFPVPTTGSSDRLDVPGADMSMILPPAWTSALDTDGVHAYGPDGEHVLLVASPKAGQTLRTWSAADVEFWTSGWGATVVTSDDSVVGGVGSRRLILTFDFDGVQSFAIAEAFIHHDLAYTLYWWSPIGDEAADTAAFQRILDSVEFAS